MKTKPSILVVDDNQSLVGVLRRILMLNGFKVITATGGMEGVNKALEENPDLILLDLAMQGLDGFQVLDYLQGRTKVPVIVISALATSDAVDGSLRRGAVAFIRKPFLSDELISTVRSNLMRSPGTDR